MRGRCEICENDRPLVRDHDHATGYIRGMLCDRCNVWLGVYEANRRDHGKRGRAQYWRWVCAYGDLIERHLVKNTGVIYVPYPRRGKPSAERAALRASTLRGLPERPVREPNPRRPTARPAAQPIKLRSKLDLERQESIERYRRTIAHIVLPPTPPKAKKKKIPRDREHDIRLAEETLRNYRERRGEQMRPPRKKKQKKRRR